MKKVFLHGIIVIISVILIGGIAQFVKKDTVGNDSKVTLIGSWAISEAEFIELSSNAVYRRYLHNRLIDNGTWTGGVNIFTLSPEHSGSSEEMYEIITQTPKFLRLKNTTGQEIAEQTWRRLE